MGQTLYYNGTIVTMEEKEPYAEAVLTEQGKILDVGSYEALKERVGKDTARADLQGNTMLPGFVDAHSHFTACAGHTMEVDLTGAGSFDEIVNRIQAYISERGIPEGQWVTAAGYDHNNLKEGNHPGRKVLDKAAPCNPLILKHQSGHMGVFNTMALNFLGVDNSTQAPQGGLIQAEEGSPTGYMEETAYLYFQSKVPIPSPEDFLKAFAQAQELYASFGITTVQEGMLTAQILPLYQKLMESGILKLDLIAYGDIRDKWKIMGEMRGHIKTSKNHIKIGGYKIFLDGSPQGRTAWMRAPYEQVPGFNQPEDYRGYAALSDEEVLDHILTAEREGMQLLAHCNGDAACQQYIDQLKVAYHLLEQEGQPGFHQGDIRPVMIHAQLAGRDQLKEMSSLGVIPSFFLAHVYYWGDVHIGNLGMERASRISPAASALKEKLIFTLHQDSPVIKPDMMETLWCAVNRRTRAGEVLGEDEQIPVWEALKAITINGAYQYFEEDKKGSLAAGKRADFVILDRNPLTAERDSLKDIQVRASIKADQVLWKEK